MTKDRFRFRVWYKQGKKFFYGIYPGSQSLPNTSNTKAFVLEQCTGLKDKNGRLIYEGDILATSNKDPHHDIWAPEYWGYTVIYWNEKNLCFAGTKWFIDGPEEESVFNAEFVEVVGNIHENPELLEEHK